jgi:hypothetical protein
MFLCSFDKKGKDVYFAGSSDEYDLVHGLDYKALHPELTILTDNWGYFQEAYERVRDNPNDEWKAYDVLLSILATGSITGLVWLIVSSIETHAFLRTNWQFAWTV